MQAGHAHVHQPHDLAVHELGGQRRLLGHRRVRRPGAGHHDAGHGLHILAPVDDDDPGGLVVDGVGHGRDYRGGGILGYAGCEQPVRAAEHRGGELGDLRRGLTVAEYHLGEALAEGAVVVDLGEAEVLVWARGEPLGGFVSRHAPGLDIGKQLSYVECVDGWCSTGLTGHTRVWDQSPRIQSCTANCLMRPKCLTLPVTTISLCWIATAAICRSGISSGVPASSRSALSFPYISAVSWSKERTDTCGNTR